MEQQDRELLLMDLSARLPYGLKCEYTSVQPGLEIYNEIGELTMITKSYKFQIDYSKNVGLSDFKPFLRKMESMSLAEFKEYSEIADSIQAGTTTFNLANPKSFDWLLRHHFDFRGLIEKGLAIEAGEGIYGSFVEPEKN